MSTELAAFIAGLSCGTVVGAVVDCVERLWRARKRSAKPEPATAVPVEVVPAPRIQIIDYVKVCAFLEEFHQARASGATQAELWAICIRHDGAMR